jgi:hypothetical protein
MKGQSLPFQKRPFSLQFLFGGWSVAPRALWQSDPLGNRYLDRNVVSVPKSLPGLRELPNAISTSQLRCFSSPIPQVDRQIP